MSSVPLDLPLPRGLRIQQAVKLGRERRAQAAVPSAPHLAGEHAGPDPVEAEAVAAEAARQRAHEEGLRAGREEGLRQGQEEGRAQARAELEALRAQAIDLAVQEATAVLRERQQVFASLLAQWREQEGARRAAAEDEIAAACFETTCRVLGEQLATPAGIRAQVAALLDSTGADAAARVRVHPRHLADLQSAAPVQACRWIADDSVAAAGCILETDARALDARLDAVLEQCRAAWLSAPHAQAAAVAAGAEQPA